MTEVDRAPVILAETKWTAEQRAEFDRRRRSRNWALFGAMIGLCLLIYAIAVVKLYHAGHMW
ncbi:hypothetical protein [Acidiphilium sp.]|uniref:hypothetical protein n=1 Tax=Acidiphilium sp. TaxID=527 RepID=UPI003D08C6EF